MPVKNTHGYTLVELMVTVAIAAIVLTLGVPSFKETIRDNRMAGHSNRFLSALNIARSEAIKRGRMVFVCKADVQATPPSCNDDACTNGTHCWEKGWMVLADINGDNLPDSGDLTIRVFEGMPNTLTFRVVGTHDSEWVAYNALGEGKGSGAGNQPTDKFRLCQGSDAANARTITINNIGRARVDKGATACP